MGWAFGCCNTSSQDFITEAPADGSPYLRAGNEWVGAIYLNQAFDGGDYGTGEGAALSVYTAPDGGEFGGE